MVISRESVVRVYNGRVGCMCGCNGKYSETDMSKTRAFNKVMKNETRKVDEAAGCVYVEENGRTTVVYFA